MNRKLLLGSGLIGLVLALFVFESRSRTPSRLPAGSSAFCEADLYETVCRMEGATRDPTGEVRSEADGEARLQAILADLAARNPKLSHSELNEELVRLIYTPKRREELRSAFRWVRSAMIDFIESQPATVFSAREKRWLAKRLKAVELEVPPPASIYADEPELLTQSDVHYERVVGGKMKLRVGGAFLYTVRSRFNLIFTMAHELAHSIDPCEVRSANLAIPSYSHLIGCFLTRKWVDLRRTRRECGANDQLSETFADWVAVQITSQALKAFSVDYHGNELMSALVNSVRDLCDPLDPDDEDAVSDTEYHPPPKIRIGRIFGHHPGIREVLGCSTPQSPTDYCHF